MLPRRHTLKVIGVCLLAYLGLVLAAAAMFPGLGATFGRRALAASIGIPIGLAAMIVLEYAGTAFLSRPFWSRMAKGARIAVLAVIGSVALALSLLRRITLPARVRRFSVFFTKPFKSAVQL